MGICAKMYGIRIIRMIILMTAVTVFICIADNALNLTFNRMIYSHKITTCN